MPYTPPSNRRIFDPGWCTLRWGVKDGFGGPSLDEARLREPYAKRATRAVWELVSNCPCGDEQSPDLNCATCGGDGYFVHHTQQVRALVTSMSKKYDPTNKIMPMEPGTALISVRGEHVPAVRDRLTLMDAYIRISGMFKRRATLAAPIERLRYPIAVWTIPVMAEGDVTKQGVEDELEVGVLDLRCEQGGVVQPPLVEDVSFEVTSEGLIDWSLGDANGKAPAAPAAGESTGGQFAVYHHAHPVYRVMEHGHALRETRSRGKGGSQPFHLPAQCLCRLEWLVRPGSA